MNRGSRNIGQAPIVFKSGAPVSVICVAATYTGVTYIDNSGKVQLSSAGVHGLTTSPAVGASVYVSWAGGTGVSGLYKVNAVDDTTKITIDLTYVAGLGTPTVAVANTEITLASFNLIPLSINSVVEILALFTGSGTSTAKTPRIRLAGVLQIYNSAITTSKTFRLDGFIKNNAVNSSQIATTNVAPGGANSTDIINTNVDTSLAQRLAVTLQVNGANELNILRAAIVKVYV